MRTGNYPSAIQRYELLEARYPFSEQAKQGQLDLMYAYYKNHAAESAVDQADQFIRENPAHPRVDYAHYIKGLVYFESGANWVERLFRADIAKRPPQDARKSFQSFQTLVQQYPKSPYAADARQRMVYLRNRLADYEVGRAVLPETRRLRRRREPRQGRHRDLRRRAGGRRGAQDHGASPTASSAWTTSRQSPTPCARRTCRPTRPPARRARKRSTR